MCDTSDLTTDVLIVGAGPVGLTAACELMRHGVRCRVIDSDGGPTPANESRALAVWARTLEVFRNVGVIGRALDLGKRLRAANVRKGNQRLARIGLDLEDTETDTPYPFTLSLPQGETERVLIGRLGGHGTEVAWRTTLTGFTQDDGGVTAALAGPDGRVETLRARWLVGCDGARSAVRHHLGLRFEGAEYEERFLLADLRIGWGLPGDEVHVWLSADGGGVAAIPLPGEGRWRLIDATGAVETDDPGRVVDRFRDFVRAEVGPDAVVTDPAWASSFRVHRRVVDRLRVSRVFLAGDAAHIHSPVGGQGMNTGIQDAYNLAWKLALACRGRAGEALLDSYQAERHPVAEQVLRGTDMATRLLTLKGTLPRSLRDHLLRLVAGLGFARRRVTHNLSELGVGYRGSPVVGEDRAGLLHALVPQAGGPGLGDHLVFGRAPHPGDRAPDVVLASGGVAGPARLFDVLSDTRHTLLVFRGWRHRQTDAAGLDAVEGLVSARYADLIRPWLVVPGDDTTEGMTWGGATLRDPDAALHRRYGAAAPCLYLIRPDGHVGYRALPPAADKLAAYLDRLFIPREDAGGSSRGTG